MIIMMISNRPVILLQLHTSQLHLSAAILTNIAFLQHFLHPFYRIILSSLFNFTFIIYLSIHTYKVMTLHWFHISSLSSISELLHVFFFFCNRLNKLSSLYMLSDVMEFETDFGLRRIYSQFFL